MMKKRRKKAAKEEGECENSVAGPVVKLNEE